MRLARVRPASHRPRVRPASQVFIYWVIGLSSLIMSTLSVIVHTWARGGGGVRVLRMILIEELTAVRHELVVRFAQHPHKTYLQLDSPAMCVLAMCVVQQVR